ncbi:MAG: DNA-protecting protein DprA [Ferruginibacter sp.]|nr:DNA-protecting protein DprA [Ferruginibacter sp.]
MNNDLIYQIALTKTPNIGDIHAKSLIQQYGDAASVFKAPRKQLEKIEGIGSVRASAIKKFNDFERCEKEIFFIEKFKITPLFITDSNYPKRLLHCYDSPPLLYMKGNINLNAEKIISVVGTRNPSDYGKIVCEKLIDDLKDQHALIVSGLAYGIDTIAHKTAIKNSTPTLAILAHGLDTLYPSQNKSLAKTIAECGGLLTEFTSGCKPDKQNFPKRNRITAGICDAVIIIESGEKGGSLITAELANGYNKDVFAIPGRTNDIKSEGCNMLIKHNKASLITGAEDLIQMMNWKKINRTEKIKQRELFSELTTSEKTIINLFKDNKAIGIDEIHLNSGLSSSSIAGALLNLEIHGIINVLPGKMYALN